VPLFVSIWRSGAGIGPAFAFLYAGPAINLVSLMFTCRVIGWGIGLWRLVSVCVMSVLIGLIMARLFRRADQHRHQTAVQTVSSAPSPRVSAVLMGLMLVLLVLGSLEMSWPKRGCLTVPIVVALILFARARLDRGQAGLWLRETGFLLRRTVPILVPAVLLMGWLGQKIPLSATRGLAGDNSLLANGLAALGGGLMYFPILTETAFVKTLLKVVGIGTGVAMSILLTAPGLSLPGMLIVSRDVHWKKVLCYFFILVILASMFGVFFGSRWGRYLCRTRLWPEDGAGEPGTSPPDGVCPVRHGTTLHGRPGCVPQGACSGRSH
jgi:uncharacterized membrane protein YraQ (UPF0718 family)